MDRKRMLLGTVTSIVALMSAFTAGAASAKTATPGRTGDAIPPAGNSSVQGVSAPAPQTSYYTGDYTPDLQFYSFNNNLQSWQKGRTKPPPLTAMQVLQWAADTGFKAVDITSYYIPGYENCIASTDCSTGFHTLPTSQIMQYAGELKAEAKQLGVVITGNGLDVDFGNASASARELDIKRTEYWTDVAAAMGAPMIRVFSGNRPSDIGQLGWKTVAQQRVVPALKQVAAYAATKGVKVGMQNHGDMTSTAAQTIQIMKWVNNPNLSIIDDTGYFRPFADEAGDDYDWYHAIAQVLPYSTSTYVKLAPAGASEPPPMDLNRLFTDFRLTSYRGYLPLERLWSSSDPDDPSKLPAPPYDEVAQFLAQVKQALAQTKVSPFVSIAQEIATLAESGDLGQSAADQFSSDLRQAQAAFTAGQDSQAMRDMQRFIARSTSQAAQGSPQYVSSAAAQTLGGKMNALLQSFHDVFGWPVSMSDTVPGSIANDAPAAPVNLTITNNTGEATPGTRIDVSVFPENMTYSPSNPSPIPPLLLDPDNLTLQYKTSQGTFATVPLTAQPGVSTPHGTRPSGALLGYLPPQAGAALRQGKTTIQLRISINGIPANNRAMVHLSLGQIDNAGNVTNPGIATASTEVNIPTS